MPGKKHLHLEVITVAMYIHTHTHSHTHTHTHTHTYVCVCVCVYACIYMCVYTHTYKTTSMSCEGMPVGVPRVTTEDVIVVVWNYRGIARASFRLNLFTICSVTNSQVIVLTDTRAAVKMPVPF